MHAKIKFPPHDPTVNALIVAETGEGVLDICKRVCAKQDALRDEGQPDIPIEIQITRPQLKQLQLDPLYADSENHPLAYPYPDAPHKTKLYFYGVLMRVEKTRDQWLEQIRQEKTAGGEAILPGHPLWDTIPFPYDKPQDPHKQRA